MAYMFLSGSLSLNMLNVPWILCLPCTWVVSLDHIQHGVLYAVPQVYLHSHLWLVYVKYIGVLCRFASTSGGGSVGGSEHDAHTSHATTSLTPDLGADALSHSHADNITAPCPATEHCWRAVQSHRGRQRHKEGQEHPSHLPTVMAERVWVAGILPFTRWWLLQILCLVKGVFGTLVKTPLNNFSKAKGKDGYLTKHTSFDYHHNAVVAGKAFLGTYNNPETRIDSMVEQRAKAVSDQNCHVLSIIVDTIKLCGMHSLP